MNYEQLNDKLNSPIAFSNISKEELIEHFKEKFEFVPFNGDNLFVFNTDREFNNRNHIISLHQKNNSRVPMHIFHYIVITYVYQGTLSITVENELIHLNAGDIIIFDKHVPHSVAPTSRNDLGVNIILSESYFRKRFINHLPNEQLISKFMLELMNNQHTHNHYLLFSTNKDRLVHNCVQNILCEHFDPAICSDDLIDNFIMILITHLVRKFKYNTNLSVKDFKNHHLMEDIMNYIHKNYKDGKLNTMCKHFGYEVSYTSKLIKEFSGMTFKQLVTEERMKRAIVLLHNDDIPIYEIASSIGINNLTSFYKYFQNYAGCTPQEYRNRNHSIDT
ncbi:MAG: AraC family transcriptional regulator [Coprobacillaceae bacterium]